MKSSVTINFYIDLSVKEDIKKKNNNAYSFRGQRSKPLEEL